MDAFSLYIGFTSEIKVEGCQLLEKILIKKPNVDIFCNHLQKNSVFKTKPQENLYLIIPDPLRVHVLFIYWILSKYAYYYTNP